MPPATLAPGPRRFLHLIPDDKFIDSAHGVFEEASPDAHDYLVIGQGSLHLIRTFEPVRMTINEAIKPQFLATLPTYSAVFIHFLNRRARAVVSFAPVDTRFIWLGWGADFYHLICSRDELLMPMTRALLSSAHPYRRFVHDTATRLVRQLRPILHPTDLGASVKIHHRLRHVGRNAPDELELVNRFAAIATPIIEDLEAIRARHPRFTVPYIDWNYVTEGLDSCVEPEALEGNNLLLGNSATPENNHLDAIEVLSRCLPHGTRIVCPLSYGDQSYGDAIERAGKARFGEHFIALREYVPAAEYARIIKSCSIVVMNHIRQQALGNIFLALCSGSRVFLHPDSPVNRTMQRIGVNISTMESLPEFLVDGSPRRDTYEVRSTRQQILDHFGRDSILNRTRVLLEDLRSTSAFHL